MPVKIHRQEEYKGYIINLSIPHGADFLHYKILVNKPFWINLRVRGWFNKTENHLIEAAKRYIDEYDYVLKAKIAAEIKFKAFSKRQRHNYINHGANLPDGDQWSDYAATESDY